MEVSETKRDDNLTGMYVDPESGAELFATAVPQADALVRMGWEHSPAKTEAFEADRRKALGREDAPVAPKERPLASRTRGELEALAGELGIDVVELPNKQAIVSAIEAAQTEAAK